MHRWAVAGFAKARLASFIPMSPSPWGRSHQGIVMSSGCCLLDESENMIRCGDWFAGCLIGWVRVHFFLELASSFIHRNDYNHLAKLAKGNLEEHLPKLRKHYAH